MLRSRMTWFGCSVILAAGPFGGRGEPAELPKVTWATQGAGAAMAWPVIVAQYLGYFKDEGIDFQVVSLGAAAMGQ